MADKRYTNTDLQAIMNRPTGVSKRDHAASLDMEESSYRRWEKEAKRRGIEKQTKETNPKKEYKVKTVVWFTDAHNMPSLDKERFKWLGRLVNEVEPDYFIDGGDFDDMNSLCRYEGNDTYKGKFKPAFTHDLESSEEARTVLSETITHKCKKHFILGNHEDRLFSFEDRNPEVYGMMQHAYFEIQKRHGWQITRYRDYLNIEGVDFTHVPMNAMNKPFGGKRAVVSVAANSIRDVCFGHTHVYGYCDEPKLGPGRSTISINGGCYMPDGYMPSYAFGSSKGLWYGAHVISISGGRIVGHQPLTIRELEACYGD